MKISQIIPAALMSVALFACQPENRDSVQGDADNANEELPPEQESSAKLLEYLVGEWELQDAGSGQQANAVDRLTFSDEARYVTYSGDQVVDSGAYRMNEQLRNLYLESEANKQPREFELDLEQDLMTLTPREQEGKGGSLTYRRVGS